MSHPHPELGPPPPLPRNTLRIIPLGGLGEIGRNMAVLEYEGKMLIIDCGVLFPAEEQPGVDLILPDFEYLRGRLDDVEAIVLTHGHEDHIGGVPFLLRERTDIPLVGSRLTLALLTAKLGEHRIKPTLIQVAEGEQHTFGSFNLEFFAVNHSIPDALAVGVRTPAGNVLHTGDFKMDQLPLDNRITDLGGFARFGAEGVDLLMSDSTNAEVPGFVTSERDIAGVLDTVFAKPRSASSSPVLRPTSTGSSRSSTSQAHGRKVAFVGRTMIRNMNIARELGYLKVPGGLLVDPRDLDELPSDEVVLVCTGSQGEPMAALSRMANRDHQIHIEPGDTVILASSLIPGNENSVNRVINGLTRWGAKVVHKGNAKEHVSGHASAGELVYCYNIVRRGTSCRSTGMASPARPCPARHAQRDPRGPVVIAEDGVVVDLTRQGPHQRRGPGRLRVRGRHLGRRRHRGRAQGPPHPRGGRLHLRGHRGGVHHRQTHRGTADPHPGRGDRPGSLRRRHPQDPRSLGAGRSRGCQRPGATPATGPAQHRPVGQRKLPATAHAGPRRHRDLTAQAPTATHPAGA